MASAQDAAPNPDVSSMQNMFEQKVINRVHFILDPILGSGQYSLSLKVNVDPSRANKEQAYFPKLGFSAPLIPRSITAGQRFEDWTKSIELMISYPSNIEADPADLKTRVENALGALGKFKVQVDLNQFTPPNTKSFLARLPWTPLTIFVSTLMLALALLSTGRLLSQIKIQMSQASTEPANSSNNRSPSDFGTDNTAATADKKDSNNANLSFTEGAKKWRELIDEDPDQARQFVEGLVRKAQPGHKGLLNYIFSSTEIKRSKSILKNINKESVEVIREATSDESSGADLTKLDHQLLKLLTTHFLDEHLDSENLLKQIHDFNMEECVEAIKFEPRALALFLRYFSTPHLEQILNRLPKENLELGLEQLRPQATQNLPEIAAKIRGRIVAARSNQVAKGNDQKQKVLQLARHLDPSREKVFYDSLLNDKRLEDILMNGNECFPQFLIPELPSEILKVVLNSYSLPDRAKIAYSFEPVFKAKLVQCYENEPRAAEALQVEFEIIEKDLLSQMNTLQKQESLNREYFGRVRKYILTSPKHILSATEVLQKWVQTGGRRETRQAS